MVIQGEVSKRLLFNNNSHTLVCFAQRRSPEQSLERSPRQCSRMRLLSHLKGAVRCTVQLQPCRALRVFRGYTQSTQAHQLSLRALAESHPAPLLLQYKHTLQTCFVPPTVSNHKDYSMAR